MFYFFFIWLFHFKIKIKMWTLIFLFLSVFISCFIHLFFASFVPYVCPPSLLLSPPPAPIHSVSSFFSFLNIIHNWYDCFTCTGNSGLYCKWGAWSVNSQVASCSWRQFLNIGFQFMSIGSFHITKWFFLKNIWFAQPVSLDLESYGIQCW